MKNIPKTWQIDKSNKHNFNKSVNIMLIKQLCFEIKVKF